MIITHEEIEKAQNKELKQWYANAHKEWDSFPSGIFNGDGAY